ncbi:hypothetical protein [Pseudoalteromonas sp. meg-B1]|uniref:hypothetical protein n=1 Tax=Pseudoalteromonas sp. meg-B1 TaxID=2203192 RepID=UPI000D6FE6AE|nr:hypothetical protein [Pseudoalteromonas sp. meg-B1]PWS55912.1 hypothetical protein DK924_03865 [Pseudoalteromonas sp. meg-B1]
MSNASKEILNCIKVTSNPFISEGRSSLDLTIQAIDKSLLSFSYDEIVLTLNKELIRLNDILNSSVGSMQAYEVLLPYKDAQYNCIKAIEYLQRRFK